MLKAASRLVCGPLTERTKQCESLCVPPFVISIFCWHKSGHVIMTIKPVYCAVILTQKILPHLTAGSELAWCYTALDVQFHREIQLTFDQKWIRCPQCQPLGDHSTPSILTSVDTSNIIIQSYTETQQQQLEVLAELSRQLKSQPKPISAVYRENRAQAQTLWYLLWSIASPGTNTNNTSCPIKNAGPNKHTYCLSGPQSPTV